MKRNLQTKFNAQNFKIATEVSEDFFLCSVDWLRSCWRN